MAGDSTVQLEPRALVSYIDINCSNKSTDALRYYPDNFDYISDIAHHYIGLLQGQDKSFVITQS